MAYFIFIFANGSVTDVFELILEIVESGLKVSKIAV